MSSIAGYIGPSIFEWHRVQENWKAEFKTMEKVRVEKSTTRKESKVETENRRKKKENTKNKKR